ncbi:MAG: sigma-70 family RNA polymerase sigma factor [Bacteroidota bacterium]
MKRKDSSFQIQNVPSHDLLNELMGRKSGNWQLADLLREEIIRELFARYYEFLVGYSAMHLRRRQYPEHLVQEKSFDIASEVFMKISDGSILKVSVKSADAWLMAIAKGLVQNESKQYRRHEEKQRTVIGPESPRTVRMTERLDADILLRQLTRHAACFKKPVDRRVFEMVMAGWTNPEIAENLDENVGWVRRRKHEILRKLRQAFQDDPILKEFID